MEKSAGDVKKGDENATVDGMHETDEKELPQNEGNNIEDEKPSSANNMKRAPSYRTLAANMQELRMNLENHLRLLEDQRPAGDDFYATTTGNEMSLMEKNAKENYMLSYEQLAANAKILTDIEITEYEEIMKQNTFNVDAEKKPSNIPMNDASSAANFSSDLNVDESGVEVNTADLTKENYELEDDDKEADDMEEASNAVEVLGQMGFGFCNLNDEAGLPTEFDQGAMKKFLKNAHNTLIKNKFPADQSHEY